MKRNIKLSLAYDGTSYHGFQRQQNALAIQQVLEEKLSCIYGEDIQIISAAARTDTKVHAYEQVVNVHLNSKIPIEKIHLAAKTRLPADIVITSAVQVPDDFHARYDAKSKKYVYHIYQSPISNPFLLNYAWHIRHLLDITLINQAMQYIIGTYDFSSFRAAGSTPTNPVRTMLDAKCIQGENNLVIMEFWGSGFLYHMVRNLVGTLVDVGFSKTSPLDFNNILASRDRSKASITAPPQGLYLKEVVY